MLLKLAAKNLFLLLLTIVLMGMHSYSQTNPLSFTSIPVTDPDLNAPGRGVEQWHDRNEVNVPIEGTNTQRLDIYFRFVWTRIEGPTLGSYTWNYFDSLVNYAIIRKQKMSFGIMPLYPGGTVQNGLVSFDGGVASYPLYLHTLMQAETVKDWRTGTVWTPNYNSPNYQNRLLALHQAINNHLNTTSFNGVLYKNVISCIDLRGYGAWGEWHSGYTPNNVISDYPAGTFPTVATLKKIVDAHTQGFPDYPLVAMIAAFDANWLQNTMNPPEIAYYVLTQRNNWGLIGWRRDQWGATDSYIASYLENNTRTFGGIVFKDSIMARWKSAPITGEPPGWNPNNFADLERQIRLYHAASFGNGNYGTTPTSTIKTRVRASSKACGYRLILEGGNVTLNGNNISVALNWKNIGQAPTYENWNVEFELKNSINQTVWSGQSQFKPKWFLPSGTATIVTDNFTSLPPGTFNLTIIIKDPNGYRDPLPLAIIGRNADGSYPVMQQITIQSSSLPPPNVAVTNNCGNSVLTASGYTGTLLWSTGETTPGITVTAPGLYTVTQTVGGTTSAFGTGTAAPKAIPSTPVVAVVNNCNSSVLSATGVTGTLLWSTGDTTSSITVTAAGSYTVTQTVNDCTSLAGSGSASPKPIPALTSSLTATATSSITFSYTATSSTPGTTFAWSRAAVTGISNAAANGNGSINETLVNTTASPVNVTYVYTLTANGCTNTQNVVVTVGIDGSIVAPGITTQPATQSRCAGVNAIFSSAASGSPGPTVQWQESNNGTSWHNITGATASTLSFATAAADNNNQYRAIWTNIAGTATSNSATLTVNSIPAAPGVSVTDNCGSSLLTATGAPEATFSWSTGATSNSVTVPVGTYTVTQTVNGCTGSPASATAAPKSIPSAPDVSVVDNCGSSLLTATGAPGATFSWSNGATTSAISVSTNGTYTVNQTVNNCTSAEGNGVAAPKPIPTLTSSLTATATSGGAFSYTATSSTPATTFAWSRAAVTGISNAAANGNGSINETLVNTTASPVNVTYVYTLTANGCTNTQNVVVTVGIDGSIISPAVTTQPASQAKCVGENITFNSGASGSPAPTVQWQESTNGTTWTNLTGATTGTLSFTASTVDNNNRYRAVWTNIAGTVNSNAATLTVNSIPSAPSVSVTNNCGSSLLTATGAPGATFSWNTGETSSSITVQNGTYTVTQTVNGCTSPAGSGTAAPKSIPVAPGVSVENNCGNSVLMATGDPGATFSWNTGATTSFITVTTPGTYTVTQTVNNCTSPSANATATPKPIPALSSSLTAAATSSAAFNYTPASSTGGTTFAWSRAAVTGISNAAANGNGSINETLVNTTASPVNVTYVYTLTANGCSNTQNVVVTVGVDGSIEAPAVTTQPFAQTRCAGVNAIFSSAASGSPGPTVQWQESTNGTTWNNITGATASTLSFTTTTADNNKQYRAIWTNIAGTATSNSATLTVNSIPAAPGVSVTDNCGSSLLTATGAPEATFSWSTGATSNSITVPAGTYTVTQTVNGCTGSPASATAAPKSIPSAPDVSVVDNCGSSLLTATGAPGATFSWSNGATTSAISVSTNGTYTVNQTVNNCTSAEGNGVAAPKPIPTLTSSLTATATSGGAFSYTATSSTPATTFAWSRATVTGISNAAANGNGSINETLVNTTASPVNVTYVYTLTANGCTNTQNVVVTVGVDGSIISPAVTTQPASQTKCVGENVTFNSGASGSPAPTVQWQESTNGTTWNNITGATSGTLSFTTTTSDNSKQYRAVWTSIAGTVNSNAATLTVNSIPSAPSVSVTDNCGTSLLTATGVPGATFSWNNGATTSAITVTAEGTYTVTQTVNGCTSPAGNGVAAPKPIPALSSSLTATATSGTAFTYTATSGTPGTAFAWSRAAVTGISNAAANGNGNINETLVNTTASPINVTYVYTLTANGCTNAQNLVVTVGAGVSIVSPTVTTQPASQTRCAGVNASFISLASGSPAPTVQWQVSTDGGFTWSNITGATTSTLSFATTTADNNKRYRAVWTNTGGTVNSNAAILTVSSIPSAPAVSVTNNCGNSELTATATGSLLWSTGATTNSITVTTAGTYTVMQTVNGCASPAGSGVAAPRPTPVLSSNLSATATSGVAFAYAATSTTAGTTFAWSRAAVTGISNTAATGTGNINEILVNTTTSPVNVTYVYTLTANGCSNNQNLIVTVNPVSTVNCVINGSIASTFTSTSIPAGRFIWFSSVIDKGNISGVTGTVTFNITNSRITFTANSQQYTLNVPNSRVRFDAAVTSATTQFVNDVWETAVPRSYNGYVFMGGLNYQVLTNLPGSISNVTWTATISIDKAGIRPTWKWAAAVYTSLGAHSVLGIKPKNGNNQNPYPNNDNAGTPENYKSFVVSGAKGTGGTNYTGSYSSTSIATCSTSVGQRPAEPEPVTTERLIVKDIPALHIELSDGEKLEATAAPNPTSTSFNLVIKGNRKSPVSIKVIDISGRVLERYEKVSGNHLFNVGQRLAAGSYFVEVIQNDQKKIIRVIKVN